MPVPWSDDGHRLAVDEEHVVALAVPHDRRVVDVVVDAHVVALARDVGEEVVALAGRVLRLRPEHRPLVLAVRGGFGQAVVVPGVEAAQVGGKRGELGVVDVVVEGVDRLLGVVLDLDARALREGHREVAHHRAALARARGERQRDERVALVPALTEEVADRRLDGRRRLAVPVHPQDDVVAAQGRRRRRDRHPHVRDDPGALHVEEGAAGARRDVREVVAVPAGRVVAAHPAALRPGLDLRELEHRARDGLREGRVGDASQQDEGESREPRAHGASSRSAVPGRAIMLLRHAGSWSLEHGKPGCRPARIRVEPGMRFALGLLALVALAGAPDTDWPHYGGSPAQTRYSPLDQITRENVATLKVAWTYDTGDAFAGSEMQCQPVVAHGVLYATSPKLRVFALDAATGRSLWSFDPNAGRGDKPVRTRIRGLMYRERGEDRRIYFAARHWLYALDARTGRPLAGFGKDGRVDLREGFEGRDPRTLTVGLNTPGVFYENLLIIGSIVPEGLPSAPGDIRAFDVRHRPPALGVPHDPAPGRARLRDLAEGRVEGTRGAPTRGRASRSTSAAASCTRRPARRPTTSTARTDSATTSTRTRSSACAPRPASACGTSRR